MKLEQVESCLMSTEFGERIVEGMSISEPLLTKDEDELIDNFFVYFAYGFTHDHPSYSGYSGPAGRVSINAETCTLKDLVPGRDKPFSKSPSDTIEAKMDFASQNGADYARYSELYPQVREFAFKEDCSETERQILQDYHDSFLKIVDSALLPFYKELAPSFFVWVEDTLK